MSAENSVTTNILRLFFIMLILLESSLCYAQNQADSKLGELLNGGDLFQLKEAYPQLKDSTSIKMLNLIAEAQLGVGFNRLENAAIALDSKSYELIEYGDVLSGWRSCRRLGECSQRCRPV